MSSTEEEEKETLPVGHPQAGYVAPAQDEVDHTGTLPPEEQEAWDARVAENEEQAKAVADHEHEVATTEPEEQAEAEQRKADEQEQMKSSSQKSSSSTSSSKTSS